ncbi:MAG: hypothetical protein DME50_09720 [Verrucomicrobia bacterium]|nr:MAG: hypothetical protein DME50_09720 [Verrucomicrobiota bacterium]
MILGSARVSRAGFGVAPKQTFPQTELSTGATLEKVRDRRTGSPDTRDACASQKNALATEGSIRHLEH